MKIKYLVLSVIFSLHIIFLHFSFPDFYGIGEWIGYLFAVPLGVSLALIFADRKHAWPVILSVSAGVIISILLSRTGFGMNSVVKMAASLAGTGVSILMVKQKEVKQLFSS